MVATSKLKKHCTLFIFTSMVLSMINFYLLSQSSYPAGSNEELSLVDVTTDYPSEQKRVLIVMVDSRFHLNEFSTDLVFYTVMINILYAEKYNYSFVAVQMLSDKCAKYFQIQWCKIKMLSYYLHLDIPDIEWILFLDSDSMLSYFADLSFFDFLDKYLYDKDLSIIDIISGEDHPGWHWMQINELLTISKPFNICTIHQYIHHKFAKRQEVDHKMQVNGVRLPVLVANTGALFVRNSRKSKQIFDEWLLFPNKYKWANKWREKWPTEQGVFNCLVTNSKRYNNTMYAFEYDSKIINIGAIILNSSYVNHITSYYKISRTKLIPKYLKSILKERNFEQCFSEYFLAPNAKIVKTEKQFESIEFNQFSLRFSA